MIEPKQIFIPVGKGTYPFAPYGVRSLCWLGDKLVDWAGGGNQIDLDGEVFERLGIYSYTFDAAVLSPSGRYAVIHTRLGTKGLLLDNGKIVRELNRSFYHANAYEYPVALFKLPDGREVIAHCPNEYDEIEIEEIASGKCLTRRERTRVSGPFHSRLAANSAGTYLMSAGWIWQPYDVIELFDVARAIRDPTSLDEGITGLYNTCCEVNSAAFLTDDRLVLSSAKGAEDFERDCQEPHLRPGGVAVYDLRESRFLTAAPVEEEVGMMMPVGTEYVVGFYEYPKLIHLESGVIVYRWPEIKSGKQLSSIIWHHEIPPHIALDAANRRFAVAGEEGITVVLL